MWWSYLLLPFVQLPPLGLTCALFFILWSMLCYPMLCEAFFTLCSWHPRQRVSFQPPKQGSVSNLHLSKAFLLRYSTFTSNSTSLKSTSSFFRQTQFLSHIFSISLYITPKVILDPFLSFSLLFIQSPNLTLSKYLFHLSFPNGVTVAPRPPPESSSCPVSPRQSPSSLLWPLYPAKLSPCPPTWPSHWLQSAVSVPVTSWNPHPMMPLMSNISSSFLLKCPYPHFQGAAHLTTPALWMCLLLQTFTHVFPQTHVTQLCDLILSCGLCWHCPWNETVSNEWCHSPWSRTGLDTEK